MKIFFATHLKNYHPYTTAFAKWFEEYGHEVELFDCIDLRLYGSPELSPYEAQQKMNESFISQVSASRPDLLFVFKGINLFKESLEEIKQKIRPIMATWWVDDPFAAWFSGPAVEPFVHALESLSVWDYFFIYETYFLKRLQRLGVSNPYYLPSATDPEIFCPIENAACEDREFYSGDLSFIGNPTRERAQMIRSLDAFDVKLWGIPWHDDYFKQRQVKTDLTREEVCKVYNYSKINLNCHCLVNVSGANVRTFDIPAAKGFMLTDNMSDITDLLYKKDTEVVTYNDLKDLKDKAQYYIKHESERKEIALNAYKKTMRKHLYKHRVEEILRVIER